MRLGNFSIGDKVYYDNGAEQMQGVYSEILFIGEHQVFLRNSAGLEFIRESDAVGFYLYQPSYDALRNIAFDLYTAIRDAEPSYTKRTPHMTTAMKRFEEAGI